MPLFGRVSTNTEMPRLAAAGSPEPNIGCGQKPTVSVKKEKRKLLLLVLCRTPILRLSHGGLPKSPTSTIGRMPSVSKNRDQLLEAASLQNCATFIALAEQHVRGFRCFVLVRFVALTPL